MIKSVVREAFVEIMESRINRTAFEKAQKDKFYVKSDKERDDAFRTLMESLTTDEQQSLLLKLESSWNFAERLMLEYAYRQGLEDSRMIHMELSEFGISISRESVESLVRV